MDAREAYLKICSKYSEEPVVMACREYEDYYGFSLAAPGTRKGKAFVGGSITLVHKETGEVSTAEYDEPYGYASKERWMPVDEEIFDTVKHSQRRVICINDHGQLVACDEAYTPFIEHHGVRGQQWGVRNGDYYPLLPSQHSSSERKAGWRKSLEGGNARSSKTSFGEMYKTASNANAARKAGASGESSSTSSSGGGAYAAMRDELIAKTKERLANSAAATDSGTKKTSKGSTGKSSGGRAGKSGKSGGKSSDDASNDQNIIELKEELKKMREELEANTESLTSGSKEEEIDDGKALNIDVEELVKESVDVDKYKETVENLLKDNEPEEVRKLIEKELLDDESGSYKELDDEVKEYLLEMVDKIIDENKSNKKSLTHYCIDNRGYLVSYEENYDLALYHHGILGMEHGKRNGPPYPLARGDHSAAERKAGWTKSLENIAKATGRGVARAARATGRGVKATGKGVASAAKATKKGLIRVNLYPKKLMSDQDILDKVERLKKEDLLKHAKGKLTNEDKAAQKLKNRDAAREIVKQLLPAIGRDLVISQIKNRLDYEFELKKKEDQDTKKWDDKVREDIYQDARSSGKSAVDASKAAKKGDSSIAPRKEENGKGKGGKGGFDPDSKAKEGIFNELVRQGHSYTEAAERANALDSTVKSSASKKNESKPAESKENTQNTSKSESKSSSAEPEANTKGKSGIKESKKFGVTKTKGNKWVDKNFNKKDLEDNGYDFNESSQSNSIASRISRLSKRAEGANSKSARGRTAVLNARISDIAKNEESTISEKKLKAAKKKAQSKFKDPFASFTYLGK